MVLLSPLPMMGTLAFLAQPVWQQEVKLAYSLAAGRRAQLGGSAREGSSELGRARG